MTRDGSDASSQPDRKTADFAAMRQATRPSSEHDVGFSIACVWEYVEYPDND